MAERGDELAIHPLRRRPLREIVSTRWIDGATQCPSSDLAAVLARGTRVEEMDMIALGSPMAQNSYAKEHGYP